MEKTHLSLPVSLSILLALVLGLGNPAASPADPAQPPRPAVSVVGLDAAQADIVDWATGLFDQAGLDLPPVVVRRHPSDEPCQGRLGIAHDLGDHTEIGLCTVEADAPVEFLVLHELAHAWDHHSLDDSRRDAFLELRGLSEWRGDAGWYERGAEQAAEIMVWGLIDRPIRSVRIDNHGCDALDAGYRTLTGAPPLHGYTDHC